MYILLEFPCLNAWLEKSYGLERNLKNNILAPAAVYNRHQIVLVLYYTMIGIKIWLALY